MVKMSRDEARELGIEVPDDDEDEGGGGARRSEAHKREIGRAQKLAAQHPHLHLFVTDQVGRNHGTPGIPDCLVFHMAPKGRKRLLFWECKASESDSLRPPQRAFLALCDVVGIETVVGTLDELLDELEL